MKILISAYLVDPDAGSEPRAAWEWIQGAHSYGHEVHVMTQVISSRMIKRKIDELGISNIFVYEVPNSPFLARFPRELKMYLEYLFFQMKLKRLVIKFNLGDSDLAHHTSWGNLGLGTGLCRTDLPYIFGPLGGAVVADARLKYFFGKYWKQEVLRTRLRNLYRFLPFSRRSVKKAKAVLCMNKKTFDLAEKLGSPNTQFFLNDSIHENFLLSERVRPTISNVLFVARLFPIKGANLAISAFELTLKSYPDATLTIVGDGPLLSEIELLTIEAGIQNSVIIRGHLTWEEVQREYAKATVFLFPSLRENFGAQLLEASAKGCPIITLENSPASEWFPPKVLFTSRIGTPLETVTNLSSAINDVLGMSNDKWIECSASALSFARENTTQNRVKAMNRVYENCLTQ